MVRGKATLPLDRQVQIMAGTMVLVGFCAVNSSTRTGFYLRGS